MQRELHFVIVVRNRENISFRAETFATRQCDRSSGIKICALEISHCAAHSTAGKWKNEKERTAASKRLETTQSRFIPSKSSRQRPRPRFRELTANNIVAHFRENFHCLAYKRGRLLVSVPLTNLVARARALVMAPDSIEHFLLFRRQRAMRRRENFRASQKFTLCMEICRPSEGNSTLYAEVQETLWRDIAELFSLTTSNKCIMKNTREKTGDLHDKNLQPNHSTELDLRVARIIMFS